MYRVLIVNCGEIVLCVLCVCCDLDFEIVVVFSIVD